MSAVPPSPDPAPAPKKQGSIGLRVFLILLLLVMLGLFGYDIYGSRAANSAFKSIEAWVDDDNLTPRTPEDVHKLLGRQPDNGLEEVEHYFQETYSWRRGRLYDTRFVKVLYRKEGDKILLHEVVQNVEPEGNDIPDKMPEPKPTSATTADPASGAGEQAGRSSNPPGKPSKPAALNDSQLPKPEESSQGPQASSEAN